MKITSLSKKQQQIMNFVVDSGDTIICDGAVRSGKTVAMVLAFVIWAMEYFERCNFAICGKTVTSAERNILRPLQQIENIPYVMKYKISTRMLTVKCGTRENYFYLFGGKDESSYALIQGLTLAGVLFDEVALMPKSFVDQSIARTLSFKNAKIWFNCNPESPNHWFYKEWIINPNRKYKYLHFLMSDNPILSADEIKRAENLFTGVFYDRYIRGMWVQADGVIFTDFAANPSEWCIKADDVPKSFRHVEVGFDIGGNGSAYALTCTAQGYDGVQYKLKSEKRQADEMAMKDIENFVIEFCSYVEKKYNVKIAIINCDHIAVVVNSLNDNTPYRAGLCYKPPLPDRIFAYSKLIAMRKVKFVENECNDLIDEMCNLVYDTKASDTRVLDDGSMQIDTWDSNIYSESGYWDYIDI